MRKSLALLAVCFAVALALASCSMSTPGSYNSLPGTWVNSTSSSYNGESYVDTIEIVYGNNGRYSRWTYDRVTFGGSSDAISTTEYGTWKTSGAMIYTTLEGRNGTVFDTASYSIRSDVLSLRLQGESSWTEFVRW